MAANWKLTVLTILLTCSFHAAGAAQTKTKISMSDARNAALAAENGKVKSAELEKEKGKQIYSFDIQMPNGIHEVNIDAVTGKLLEDTIESAKDEAQEAAKDKAAEAKKKRKRIRAQ